MFPNYKMYRPFLQRLATYLYRTERLQQTRSVDIGSQGVQRIRIRRRECEYMRNGWPCWLRNHRGKYWEKITTITSLSLYLSLTCSSFLSLSSPWRITCSIISSLVSSYLYLALYFSAVFSCCQIERESTREMGNCFGMPWKSCTSVTNRPSSIIG